VSILLKMKKKKIPPHMMLSRVILFYVDLDESARKIAAVTKIRADMDLLESR